MCWHRVCPGTAPADFSMGEQNVLRIPFGFSFVPEWMRMERGCFISSSSTGRAWVPVTLPGLPPYPAPELSDKPQGQGQPLGAARSSRISLLTGGVRQCQGDGATPWRRQGRSSPACEGKSRLGCGLVTAPGAWGDVLRGLNPPSVCPGWVWPCRGPQERRDGVEGGGGWAVVLCSPFSQVWGCGRGGAAVLYPASK